MSNINIYLYSNYRDYLRDNFSLLKKVNESYSLRAYAKKLGIAPSFLSGLLRGNKGLSSDKAILIAEKLTLSKKESQYFHVLTQLESAKSIKLKESLIAGLKTMSPEIEFTTLEHKAFKIISDWKHFAIMASTELDDFAANKKNIGNLFGLSLSEVEGYIANLTSLRLIGETEEGGFCKIDNNPRFASSVPNSALRKYHKETLGLAIESIEGQSPQEKIIGSEVVAIDDSKINEFSELMEDFFTKVKNLSNSTSGSSNAIYYFGVQGFRLNNKRRKK